MYARKKKALPTFQKPQVNRLCISPDKRYLAAAGHHTVKLYDIKSTNPNAILTFDGHTSNVTGVAFHCEGKWMVTSSEDGEYPISEPNNTSLYRSHTMDIENRTLVETQSSNAKSEAQPQSLPRDSKLYRTY